MDLANYISSINWLGVGSVILTVLCVIAIVVIYVCKAVGVYMLSTKTSQKHTWMAFVPILQDMKVFNMAGLSSKLYVVFYCIYRALYSAKLEWGVLAPIWWIGVAFYVAGLFYARYQMAKNFGGNQAVCILNMFFEPFVLLYILSQKMPHQYCPLQAKVDYYLKAYGLYEDPSTFANPKAKTEAPFAAPQQNNNPQQNFANQEPVTQNNGPVFVNVEKD